MNCKYSSSTKLHFAYISSILCIILNLSSLKAQHSELKLHKENEDLVVNDGNLKVVLKNLLIDEVNGHFELEQGDKDCFYVIYEYYASYIKSMVVYSLQYNDSSFIVNKIVHFNYNDKQGIPFGWIFFCNIKMAFDSISYESLTAIESQMLYDSFQIDEQCCSVNISNGHSEECFFKASKSGKLINITLPLFFEDETNIGIGRFSFNAKNWDDLSMDFPIYSLQSDYFEFNKEISVKNVRHFNDIAYYLEQSCNYKEAIKILDAIIIKFPHRTVAYINLGDAYWELDNKSEAKKAYREYVDLMKSNGLETQIPQRVYTRINE